MAASRRAFSTTSGSSSARGSLSRTAAIASLTAAKRSSDEVLRCSMASSHHRSGSS